MLNYKGDSAFTIGLQPGNHWEIKVGGTEESGANVLEKRDERVRRRKRSSSWKIAQENGKVARCQPVIDKDVCNITVLNLILYITPISLLCIVIYINIYFIEINFSCVHCFLHVYTRCFSTMVTSFQER